MKTTTALDRFAAFVAEVRAELRQLAVPSALRIACPAAAADAAPLTAALDQLAEVAAVLKKLADEPSPPPNDERRLHRPYADLANGWLRVWNLTRQPGTGQPKEEMRRVVPHLESLRDTLESLGLEIIDHTGKEIPDGLDLEVIGYQVRPGLKRDRVVDTVRPTVYFRDQMIQKGRVLAETGTGGAAPSGAGA